jgi:hypothetical protein
MPATGSLVYCSASYSSYPYDCPTTDATFPYYGYPRFGNRLGRGHTLTHGYDEAISTGRTMVEFNHPWGNVIGKLFFTTTSGEAVQMVAGDDIGQAAQGAIFANSQAPWTSDLLNVINPTQAGGSAYEHGDTSKWTGSPVLSRTASTGSDGTTTDTSYIRPFNYLYNVVDFTASGACGTSSECALTGQSTGLWEPLLWRGVMTRATQIGYSVPSIPILDNVLKVTL